MDEHFAENDIDLIAKIREKLYIYRYRYRYRYFNFSQLNYVSLPTSSLSVGFFMIQKCDREWHDLVYSRNSNFISRIKKFSIIKVS